MNARRVAAALALVAAGVVGFAIGASVSRETESHVTDADSRPRTFVLRHGDVVVRPEAAARCEASAEGGSPNLFCRRTRAGRHDVVFFSDVVLVWPHARGPDGPPFAYRWRVTP